MPMADYRVPVEEMRAALAALSGLERLHAEGLHADLTEDLLDAVLDEAARFAEQELAPLYRSADLKGATLADGRVRSPDGFREAYAKFVQAGWAGISAPPAYGGQGLPNLVSVPIAEMWRQANLAFALCPMLSQSAVEALNRHGSESLKAVFLPKLATGEWAGTMNLTEPQAGSDLASIETLAVPDDGRFRINGRKIFITWGDHDLTENIVHFVLARTPGAPAGVKGISLFVVPKFLPGPDGSLGERNEVTTVSLEHKLGIHGSPTCVLSYGGDRGAAGYLVGAEHEGLACMFTMMNRARLAVGVEALGVAQRAYGQALAYARERVQGVAPGRSERGPIIGHPDVRRMLLAMKSAVAAMRALAYSAAIDIDLGEGGVPAAAERASLLTPIVKGWCSELSQEVVSLGLQVHGGAGYIEETGAAQPVRDVRITAIYEGTTGIQANDLLKRKIIADGGRALFALLAELRGSLAGAIVDEGLSKPLRRAADDVERAVRFVLAEHWEDPALAGAVGVNMLLGLGVTLGGWRLALQAAHAGPGDRATAERALARFYAEHWLPRNAAYCGTVLAGSAGVMGLPEERF
jgi:alkylation response protein AidB-like acyl-CoA dehydrogenase